MLELSTKRKNQIYQIQLKGALTGKTFSDFKKFCDDVIEKGYSYIIFDFQNLNYISSSGLSSLIYIGKRLKDNSGFGLIINCNDETYSLLNFLGITNLLKIKKDYPEAIKFVNSSFPQNFDTDIQEVSPEKEKHPSEKDKLPAHVKHDKSQLAKEKTAEVIKTDLDKSVTVDFDSTDKKDNAQKQKETSTVESALNNDEMVADAIILDDTDIEYQSSDKKLKSAQIIEGDELDGEFFDTDTTNENNLEIELDDFPYEIAKDTQTVSRKGDPQTAAKVSEKEKPIEGGGTEKVEKTDRDFIILNSNLDSVEHELDEDFDDKFQDFFIKCQNCHALLRIKKYGKHYCPDCKKTFSISKSKEYHF
jgi:anti-anti-sigma factor